MSRLSLKVMGIALACAGSLLLAGSGRGDEVRFRRTYAPADQVSAWPLDPRTRYLPVEPATFDELARQGAAKQGEQPSQAALRQAEYRARLSPSGDLQGTATWTFNSQSDKGSSQSLEPCSLTLQNPRWFDQSSALLGRGSDGQLRVVVQSDRQLTVDWSLHAARSTNEATTFRLPLPRSSVNQLILDLPSRYQVRPNASVLVDRVEAAAENVTWHLHLVDPAQTQLELFTQTEGGAVGVAVQSQSRTLLHEAGGDLEVQVQARALVGNLQDLRFTLDPGLEILAAQAQGEPLEWNLEPRAADGTARGRIKWTQTGQTSQQVNLTLVMARPGGRRWKLPQVRWEGVLWLGGTAEVVLNKPLAVAGVQTGDARQTGYESQTDPEALEILRFDLFRSDAAIELDLQRLRRRMRVDLGTQLQVSDDQAQAQIVIHANPSAAPRRTLRANVASGWVIDRVETLDGSSTLDWNLTESESGPPRLTIQLPPARAKRAGIQLLVHAHRPLESEASLGVADATILDVRAVELRRQLTAIAVEPAAETKISSAAIGERVEANRLTPEEVTLFLPKPEGTVFRIGKGQDPFVLDGKGDSTAPEINLSTQVVIRDNRLAQQLELRCAPQAEPVERLLLQFHPRTRSEWTWNLKESAADVLQVRRLETPDGETPSAAETWELRLRRPLQRPFVIQAATQREIEPEVEIPLPRVVGAPSQQASVAVYSDQNQPLDFRAERLTPTTLAKGAVEQVPLKAAFRYVVTDDFLPQLHVGLNSGESVLPGAWIWQCQVESRIAAQSTATHLATLDVFTAGKSEIEVTFPEGATNQHVWLDEQGRVEAHLVTSEQPYRIALAAEPSHRRIYLEYATRQGLPHLMTKMLPPFPTVNVPMLSRRWSVSLPWGYSLETPCWSELGAARTPPNWRQRLWGFLGRGTESSFWTALIPGTAADPSTPASRAAVELITRTIQSEARVLLEKSVQPRWGDLLANLPTSAEVGAPVLLIDQWALEQSQITPTSLWPAQTQRGPDFIAGLAQQHLALLVFDRVVLLTSDEVIRACRDQTTPMEQGVGYALRRGSLAQSLLAAAQEGEHPRWQPAALWRLETNESSFPLRPVIVSAASEFWTTQSIDWDPVLSSGTWIQFQPALVEVSWLCFAISFLLMSYGVRQRYWGWVLCVMGLLVALVVVPPFIPFTSAVFAGMFVSQLWKILTREDKQRIRAWRHRARWWSRLAPARPRAAVAAGALLLGLFAVATIDARAPESATVPEVFVPVDSQGKPNGDRYQVPEALLAKLRQQAQRTAAEGVDWMLTDVRCAVTPPNLTQLRSAERLGVRFVARLHVRQGGGVAQLAWPQRDQLVMEELTLDGQRLPLDQTGVTLAVPLTEAGEHLLEIHATAALSRVDDRAQLVVPLLACGTAVLDLPAAADLPQATTAVITSNEHNAAAPHAGSKAQQIVLTWPLPEDEAALGARPMFDQIQWLRESSGRFTVELRLKFKGIAAPLHRIELRGPLDWLLQASVADPQVAKVRRSGTHLDRWVVEFSEPVMGDAIIGLQAFALQGAHPANLTVPFFEVLDAKPARRLLGLSLARSWSVDSSAITSDPESLPEVQQFFGGENDLPSDAFRVTAATREIVLRSRAEETPWSIEQSSEAKLVPNEIVSTYDLRLKAAPPVQFQLDFAAPRALRVEGVTAQWQGQDQVVRWSRPTADTLRVMLSHAAESGLAVQVRMRTPVKMGEAFDLPIVKLATVEGEPYPVELLRQRSVVATVDHPSAVKLPLGSGNQEEDDALLPMQLTLQPGETGIPLRLDENHPEVQGTQTIRLVPLTASWMLRMQAKLQVSQGQLDVLEFALPVDWPLEAQPKCNERFEVIPPRAGQGGRLIIEPSNPIRGDYELQVDVVLTQGRGDQIHLLEMRPLGMNLARQVILPREVDGNPLNWSTRHLRVVEDESDDQKLPTRRYEVVGDSFEAQLLAAHREQGEPLCLLADSRVLVVNLHQAVGELTFDLELPESKQVELQLEPGQELIDVRFGGNRPVVRKLAADRYQLRLDHQSLIGPLQVLYLQTLVPREVHHLVPPRLVDLRTETALTQCYAPGEFLRSSRVITRSPRELILARMKTIPRLIENARPNFGELDPLDWQRIRQAMMARYEMLRKTLGIDPDTPSQGLLASEVEQLDREVNRERGNRATTPLLNERGTAPPRPALERLVSPANVQLVMRSLGNQVLGVDWEAPQRRDSTRETWTIVSLASLLIVMVHRPWHALRRAFPLSWVLVAAGIWWGLVGILPWLGWGLALVSLFAALPRQPSIRAT